MLSAEIGAAPSCCVVASLGSMNGAAYLSSECCIALCEVACVEIEYFVKEKIESRTHDSHL